MILLPMHAAYLACADGSPAPAAPMVLPPMLIWQSGTVAPKRIRMVDPQYPEDARAHRREGVVILEVLIAPEGCVSRAEVRQSVSPDLDVSALRAVSGAQFAPTVLNGRPVPVIVTFTVQFSLQ